MGSAGGVFTNKLAFGFGAKRLGALPVADWFGADGFAFGLGDLAMGDAVWWVADIYAFGAVHHLTSFIRAHRLAVRSGIINSRI